MRTTKPDLKHFFLGKPLLVLILLIPPLLCHILLSPFGYNPTDDGFYLAVSRRIASGEIPYRDFFFSYPPMTPLLHIFEVLLTKAHIVLFSRFIVWLELFLTSLLFVSLVTTIFDEASSKRISTFLLSTLSVFFINSAYVLLTPWTTLDAILFSILSFYIIVLGHKTQKASWEYLGIFLSGILPLFRLPFLALSIYLMLMSINKETLKTQSTGRIFKKLTFFLLPILAFIFYLTITRTLKDFCWQVLFNSKKGLIWKIGVQSFINNSFFIQGMVLSAATLLIVRFMVKSKRRALGHLLKWALSTGFIIYTLATGYRSPSIFIYKASFLAYGLLAGIFTMLIGEKLTLTIRNKLQFRKILKDKNLIFTAFVLVLSWVSSISYGANSPFWITGILSLSFLWLTKPRKIKQAFSFSMLIITLASLLLFTKARTNNIYRERSITELKYELSFLPGFKGIYTNEANFEYLKELHRLVSQIRGENKTYAVLPQFPGYWACTTDKNPVPLIWPENACRHNGVYNEKVRKRICKWFLRSLENAQPVVLFSRCDARKICTGKCAPFTPEALPVKELLKTKFEKVAESAFWEVYQMTRRPD